MMEAAKAAPFSDSYLSWEVFLTGGCSLVVWLLAWSFTDKTLPVTTVAELGFGLSFIVNYPHSLASYCLLYGDFKKEIIKRPRYFWAGVIVPVLLAGILIRALISGNQNTFAHMINLMFFTVGWHYVKQVFGCVIVSS